jgi:hypothetical protein
VIFLARTWLTLYTTVLPLELRHRRRLEILGDIEAELADGVPAHAVVQRMVRGAYADVAWTISSSVEGAHPVHAPGGVFVLGLSVLVPLWLLAERLHLRGGAWAAASTASYALFWATVLAALIFTCVTLARSLSRRRQR